MLRILYNFEKRDPLTLKQLSETAIIFIPVINFDGFAAIDSIYQNYGKIEFIRKNRRKSSPDSNCRSEI